MPYFSYFHNWQELTLKFQQELFLCQIISWHSLRSSLARLKATIQERHQIQGYLKQVKTVMLHTYNI